MKYKYQVTESFSIPTTTGSRQLEEGQVIALSADKAQKYSDHLRRLLPAECEGCAHQAQEYCCASIKRIPCEEALPDCAYQQSAYKNTRYASREEVLEERIGIFSRACKEVDEQYPAAFGCLPWLRQNRSEIIGEIRMIERKLAQPLGMPLKQFYDMVKRWKALHHQGINQYLKMKGRKNGKGK
jgi:hypothetical protein